MRKSYTTAIFFIAIILSLVYNILINNKRVDSFFKFHRDIADIVVVNDKLNKFIDSPINFKNFDLIKESILLSKQKILSLEKEILLISNNDNVLKEDFYLLKNGLEKKIELIENLKSYRAILNNSFRNLIKLFPSIENKEYIKLYTNVITLNINPDSTYDELNNLTTSFIPSTKYEKLFLVHYKIIFQELVKYNNIKEEIKNLRLDSYIAKFEYKYSSFIKSIIEEVKDTILILVLILAFILGLFLVYAYGIIKDQIELKRFKNAVENSDNFIVVTDANKKIKYINSSMLKSMGYKIEEVIGKDPSIFKAGFIDKHIYKRMNEAIYSGKKWTGEFVNKTKDGKLIYEKASITPILDEDGKIEEFLGIKLDITKEKGDVKLIKRERP